MSVLITWLCILFGIHFNIISQYVIYLPRFHFPSHF